LAWLVSKQNSRLHIVMIQLETTEVEAVAMTYATTTEISSNRSASPLSSTTNYDSSRSSLSGLSSLITLLLCQLNSTPLGVCSRIAVHTLPPCSLTAQYDNAVDDLENSRWFRQQSISETAATTGLQRYRNHSDDAAMLADGNANGPAWRGGVGQS